MPGGGFVLVDPVGLAPAISATANASGADPTTAPAPGGNGQLAADRLPTAVVRPGAIATMPAARVDPTAMLAADPTAVLAVDRTTVLAVDPTTVLGVADTARPAGVIALYPPPGGEAPDPPVVGVGSVPVVRGIRCNRGHFNHPDVAACVRCRIPVDPARRAFGSGTRPPLGILVLDDGSIVALDRDHLLGRAPDTDTEVASGALRGLTLAGDGVADLHATLRISDWSLIVVDRHSPAGTHLLTPGSEGWSRVRPSDPRPVPPGTHMALGSRVLTFLGPWPS